MLQFWFLWIEASGYFILWLQQMGFEKHLEIFDKNSRFCCTVTQNNSKWKNFPVHLPNANLKGSKGAYGGGVPENGHGPSE